MIAVDGMLNKSVTAQFVASCPQGVAGPGRVKVTITTSVMGRKQTTKELNSEDMIGLAKSIRKHMKQTEKDTPDYKNYKAFLQLVKFASMPLE